MSETDSIALYEDESVHINPVKPANTTKTNNKVFQTSTNNASTVVNRCVNVLSMNKISNKYTVN